MQATSHRSRRIGTLIALAALGCLAPLAATAQTANATVAADLPWADAEVRRIDAAAGKISLRHGEIRNIDMPPMTMVFQMEDPARLAGLAVGDRVRFTAVQRPGAYTVLQIEKQP